MLYVRCVHLTKAKPIHKRQTYPLVRQGVIHIRTMMARVQLQNKVSGRDSQGSWRHSQETQLVRRTKCLTYCGMPSKKPD
jgi:hypothetical protein